MATKFVLRKELPPNRSLTPRVGLVEDQDFIIFDEATQTYIPKPKDDVIREIVITSFEVLNEYTESLEVTEEDLYTTVIVNLIEDNAQLILPEVGSDGQYIKVIVSGEEEYSLGIFLGEELTPFIVLKNNEILELKYINDTWVKMLSKGYGETQYSYIRDLDLTSALPDTPILTTGSTTLIKSITYILTELGELGEVLPSISIGYNDPDFNDLVSDENLGLELTGVNSSGGAIFSGKVYIPAEEYPDQAELILKLNTQSDATAYVIDVLVEYINLDSL